MIEGRGRTITKTRWIAYPVGRQLWGGSALFSWIGMSGEPHHEGIGEAIPMAGVCVCVCVRVVCVCVKSGNKSTTTCGLAMCLRSSVSLSVELRYEFSGRQCSQLDFTSSCSSS